MTRAVLAVVPLSLALVSCGGADDPRPAPRPEPAAQRSVSPPHSPDAGIPEGHAVADARARRCRAARPARLWRRCDKYAR